MKSALLCLVFAVSLPVVQAEVYRWVDENGQTHYSNIRPKASANAEQLPGFDKPYAESPSYSPVRPPVQRPSTRKSSTKVAKIIGDGTDESITCRQYKRSLDAIQDRLRKGDTKGQGESLSNRRRALTKLIAEKCR